MPWQAIGFAVIITAHLSLSSAQLAADAPPKTWVQADGNPLEVDGEARWRADRLWPVDPLQPEAYLPMPWREGGWQATEHAADGQPRIAVEDGVVLMRTAANTRQGHRVPALAYLVPADGWYGLAGHVQAKRLDGYGYIRLHLVRRSPERVDRVHEWLLEPDQRTPLGKVAVKAERGEELVLVLTAERATVDAHLHELAFGPELADAEVRANRERLADLKRAPVTPNPTDEQMLAVNEAVMENHKPGDVVYPPAARVRNVKAFGAVGDGKHDDTAAFQLALESAQLVYVPDGTYLITDTLRWTGRQTRTVLEGQSRDGVVIKLMDQCPGFQNPAEPQAMVWTGKAPAQRFRNSLRNLTLDVGRGNPGSIGLQFMANNQGGVFDLTIRSSDPQRIGKIGLDLGYSDEQGPCLIQRVTVEGFDIGVSTVHAVNSITAEHITLRDQRTVGWLNDGQCISLRGLRSDNAVTAYHNKGGASLTAIIDSELRGKGGAKQFPAIINESAMFARNIQTVGYAKAIEHTVGTGHNAEGARVDEFVSHDVLTLFEDTPPRSLNLPIKDAPVLAYDPPENWVNVADFKEHAVQRTTGSEDRDQRNPKIDWSPAVQAAIDSGAKTIYLPTDQTIGLFSDIRVRGNVQRIIGLERGLDKPMAKTNVKGKFPPDSDWFPTFIIEDGASPLVVIERFDLSYTGTSFVHRSDRTLVIRNLFIHKVIAEEGAGDLFLEDVVGAYLELQPGTRAWARQLNVENWHQPKTLNRGGDLWVLGVKTETDTSVHRVEAGGRSEFVGGFVYSNKAGDPEKVMFHNDNSSLSFTVGEWVIRQQPFDLVRQTQGDETRLLEHGQAHRRGHGSVVPLYVSQPQTPSPQP